VRVAQRSTNDNLRRLSFPSFFVLSAAEGWLDLGNPAEGLLELEKIATAQRLYPDVLYVRWRLLATLGRWNRCLVVARALAAEAPDDPRSWIVLAESWRGKGRLEKAFATAVAQAKRFRRSWELLYGAARYACLSGNFKDTAHFLSLAMATGNPGALRRRAQADPDLQRFWQAKS
jgi:hypothetical protein